jgi:glycosyltransferase involved in cell wall biosynthesis
MTHVCHRYRLNKHEFEWLIGVTTLVRKLKMNFKSQGERKEFMVTNEKISVLMAVYNTDFSLVKRAIDSVLNQDYQKFELIIIDDGTHYGGHNRLAEYVEKHQNKITYIWHSNRGQSKSINRGLLNATGTYVTIIDADDEYKPEHLGLCLQEMRTSDLIASTTLTIVDCEDDYFVTDVTDRSKLIHVDDCTLFATLFGKREVFLRFPFETQYASDADFLQRASKQFRVNKVDLRTYVYYRNMPNSICAIVKKQNSAILS